MARGGNKDPGYNLREDLIIASAICLPLRLDHPVIVTKARSFLRSRFPESQVDKFVSNLPNALGHYFSLSCEKGGQREALKSKMARIAKAASELGDALGDIDYLEYGALQATIAAKEHRPWLAAEILPKLRVIP